MDLHISRRNHEGDVSFRVESEGAPDYSAEAATEAAARKALADKYRDYANMIEGEAE